MAWFKKKQSPVERRLDELNQQIAELEAQLRREQEEEAQRAADESASPQHNGHEPASHVPDAAPENKSRPRFRTTVTPKNATPIHGIEPHEVDFFARRDRSVDFSHGPGKTPPASKDNPNQHTASNGSTSGILDAIAALFRRPKPQRSQERLASFLTTGSFQTLKPLKYERRVARNRLIIIVLIIAVVAILIYKFWFS